MIVINVDLNNLKKELEHPSIVTLIEKGYTLRATQALEASNGAQILALFFEPPRPVPTMPPSPLTPWLVAGAVLALLELLGLLVATLLA